MLNARQKSAWIHFDSTNKKEGEPMEFKDAKLHIRGTQTSGEDNTVMDFYIDGQVMWDNDRMTLTYPEPEENGLGSVNTILRLENDTVTMERKEMPGSMLTIQRGRRHICQYETQMGSFFVGVMGGEINLERKDRHTDLFFDYAIDINTSLASRNTVRITMDERA